LVPRYYDEDGDDVLLYALDLPEFGTRNDRRIVLQPSRQDIGSYTVKLQLIDIVPSPRITTMLWTITVISRTPNYEGNIEAPKDENEEEENEDARVVYYDVEVELEEVTLQGGAKI